MSLKDSSIVKLWKDPEFSGSFQSAKAFQSAVFFEKKIHLSLHRIYKILSKLPEFLTLIKPMRHFNRRNYSSVHGFFKLVQIDVALMFKFGIYSNFFVAVDVFSHKIFAQTMRNKTIKEVQICVNKIFNSVNLWPESVQSDRGKEFTGKELVKLFSDHGTYFTFKKKKKKASFAEWAIYRIKKVLYSEMYSKKSRNWPSMLSQIVKNINDTPSPSLNYLRPSQISSPLDDYIVDQSKPYIPQKWQNKIKKDDFKVGDVIILDKRKQNFDKSYKLRVRKN